MESAASHLGLLRWHDKPSKPSAPLPPFPTCEQGLQVVCTGHAFCLQPCKELLGIPSPILWSWQHVHEKQTRVQVLLILRGVISGTRILQQIPHGVDADRECGLQTLVLHVLGAIACSGKTLITG